MRRFTGMRWITRGVALGLTISVLWCANAVAEQRAGDVADGDTGTVLVANDPPDPTDPPDQPEQPGRSTSRLEQVGDEGEGEGVPVSVPVLAADPGRRAPGGGRSIGGPGVPGTDVELATWGRVKKLFSE